MNYFIHNTSRAVTTRIARAKAPTHRGMRQMLADYRLVRARPVKVTEEFVRAHLDEIKAREKLGIVELRTVDGRKIDLNTLAPVAALVPAAPLPEPVLDSLVNDKPSGMAMPMYPHGAVQSTAAVPAPAEVPVTSPAPVDDEEEVEYSEESSRRSSNGKKNRR